MITNVKGAQAACGTDAAGASTFGSATESTAFVLVRGAPNKELRALQ